MKDKGVIQMDINSMMSMDLAQLQQTVQMSVLQNAMNMQTTAAVQLLEAMPEPAQAAHLIKGQLLTFKFDLLKPCTSTL